MTFIGEAEDALSCVFSEQHRGLWMACYPSQIAMAPSHSNFTFKFFSEPEVRRLKDAIDKLARDVTKLLEALHNLHNESFWRGFVQSLHWDLTCGILGAGEAERSRRTSEAEVRVQLLDPLLKRLAHSAQCIAVEGSTGEVFSSSLSVEVNTVETRRPGRRPQVDYLLSAHAGKTLLYCVPIEAKGLMDKKEVAQLSMYQATVSNGDKVGLGLLVDKDKVRFSFSVFAHEGKPLPLTLVIPTLTWRKGCIVQGGICVLMAFLLKLQRQICAFPFEKSEVFVKDVLVQSATMYSAKQFTADPELQSTFVMELIERISRLEKKVDELSSREIRRLEKKVDDLSSSVQEAVSPSHQDTWRPPNIKRRNIVMKQLNKTLNSEFFLNYTEVPNSMLPYAYAGTQSKK